MSEPAAASKAPLPPLEAFGKAVLTSWWFFGVGAVSVVGLAILASVPWPWNRFALDAVTTYVEVVAAAPWRQQLDLVLRSAGEFQVIGADPEGAPAELAGAAGASPALQLAAGRVTLQAIALEKEGRLAVGVLPDGRIDLMVGKGGRIELAIAGKIDQIAADGTPKPVATLERASAWHIYPAGKEMARLVLPKGAAPPALFTLPATDLRFSPPRSVTVNQQAFQSEITGGKLKLLDTTAEEKLAPRGLILLSGGDRRIVSRLETTKDAIEVDVVGEANRISLGPARPGSPLELDRDITPTILAHIVGQHELKLLWVGVLAVLGGLWKARQEALKWGAG